MTRDRWTHVTPGQVIVPLSLRLEVCRRHFRVCLICPKPESSGLPSKMEEVVGLRLVRCRVRLGVERRDIVTFPLSWVERSKTTRNLPYVHMIHIPLSLTRTTRVLITYLDGIRTSIPSVTSPKLYREELEIRRENGNNVIQKDYNSKPKQNRWLIR